MCTEKPLIFNYQDYREFLKDTYSYLKKNSRYFSFRYFSKTAGFTSPNIFKLVMDGDRNLSTEGVGKFLKGLKLGKNESEFFKILVKFNQAKSSVEKQSVAEEILKFKAYRKIYPLGQAQYNYYSNWYFIAIREMVALPGVCGRPGMGCKADQS